MEPFHADWFGQYKYDSFCMQSETTTVRCHKNSWIYLTSTYYWWLLRPTITIWFDSKFLIIAQLYALIDPIAVMMMPRHSDALTHVCRNATIFNPFSAGDSASISLHACHVVTLWWTGDFWCSAVKGLQSLRICFLNVTWINIQKLPYSWFTFIVSKQP